MEVEGIERKRPVMPKLFVIGLSRTGTKSLCKELGNRFELTVKHWPMHMWDIQAHDCSGDITVSFRYKHLDKLYPGSKFILTTRDDIQSWLVSCQNWWGRPDHPKMSGDPEDGIPACSCEAEVAIYGQTVFDADVWLAAYKRHHDDVIDYFKDRPNDLLLLDLNLPAGQKRLKLDDFVPFAHENSWYEHGIDA